MSYPYQVTLKRGRSKPLWIGHPWVFSGAIHTVSGPKTGRGGPCLVEDERGNVLGAGFYNPDARIAVRLYDHRRTTDVPFEPRPLGALLEARVAAALGRRATLGLGADPQTTAYRLVNSEGDGLSGLVVDRLGDALSVQLNARAMYEQRAALGPLLARLTGAGTVVAKVTDEASKREGIPVETEVLVGDGAHEVELLEGGVRYGVAVGGGQKTGFYCDQRDNRARFAARCEGRRVLDLYSYVGGFGLAALKAGAASVEAVDSSRPAVDAALANAQRNGVADRYSAVTEDAMNFLKAAHAQGRSWDRIVCDPPKFAHGRAGHDDALKKYARLNTLAMGVLAPGGLMLSCSCSQHVTEDEFLRVLTDAGHRLRRAVHVHAVWSQGPDHPWLSVAAQGKYLKAVLLTLGDA